PWLGSQSSGSLRVSPQFFSPNPFPLVDSHTLSADIVRQLPAAESGVFLEDGGHEVDGEKGGEAPQATRPLWCRARSGLASRQPHQRELAPALPTSRPRALDGPRSGG